MLSFLPGAHKSLNAGSQENRRAGPKAHYIAYWE